LVALRVIADWVLQRAHEPAREVVQAGAVSEQVRQDVEVDHDDQAAFEQRRAGDLLVESFRERK
jgi:hypothetical protein